MHRSVRKVRNKHVLKLICKYLLAGVIGEGRLEQTRKGLRQGGPLSPLLTDIDFDEMDKELELGGHCFVRYAD